MWVFVSAGILYLLGVAVVLYVKPAMMFTPDGQWKEFGIGQDEARYSPFPFWLFCLAWGIVSYTLIVILTTIVGESNSVNVRNSRSVSAEQNVSNAFQSNVTKMFTKSNAPQELNSVDFSEGTEGLPNGYYVLNKKATRLSGMPKYVFVGNSPPVE
jgi:hypothetical protein